MSQFISQHLAPDEIRGLRELFASMDADGSGTITLDELRTVCGMEPLICRVLLLCTA